MGPVQASVCNHVKISQRMSDSSSFISLVGVLGDGLQRDMLALPNYTHSPEAGVDGSKIKCESECVSDGL